MSKTWMPTAGMAHPPTRRRGKAGDNTNYWLGNIGFDELSGLLFIITTDLSDQDDAFGGIIFLK